MNIIKNSLIIVSLAIICVNSTIRAANPATERVIRNAAWAAEKARLNNILKANQEREYANRKREQARHSAECRRRGAAMFAHELYQSPLSSPVPVPATIYRVDPLQRRLVPQDRQIILLPPLQNPPQLPRIN